MFTSVLQGHKRRIDLRLFLQWVNNKPLSTLKYLMISSFSWERKDDGALSIPSFSMSPLSWPSVVLTAAWVDAGGGNTILNYSGCLWPLLPHMGWQEVNSWPGRKRSGARLRFGCLRDSFQGLCIVKNLTIQFWFGGWQFNSILIKMLRYLFR